MNDSWAFATAKAVNPLQMLQFRHPTPVVVAVDGGSGAGKSTLASQIVKAVNTALIPMDDFYAADIPDHYWGTFSIEERLQRAFDWQRLRNDVIKPLPAGKSAQWYPFDYVAGVRADGTYGMQTTASFNPRGAWIFKAAASALGPCQKFLFHPGTT